MSVIVAIDPSCQSVLWAKTAKTTIDEKLIMQDEIMRLLYEFENPKGVNLELSEDAFGETILQVRYAEDSYLEYKIMDGEKGR